MGFFRNKRGITSISVFYRQMASMVASGVDTSEALEILSDDNDSREVEALVRALKSDISSGNTPGENLTSYPGFFKDLLRFILNGRAGKKEFAEILYGIADESEVMEELRLKAYGAMFYPFTTIIVALLVMALILVFVIPTFNEMFSSFGSALPLPTMFVITICNFITDYFYLLLGLMVLVIVLVARFRGIADTLMLKIPGLGKIIQTATVIRFSRYLSMLLYLDAPLKEAVESAAGSVQNTIYSGKLDALARSVTDMGSLKSVLAESGIFSPMGLRIIAAGERSGNIASALKELAVYYEKGYMVSVNRFIRTFEVATTIGIALIVGGVVIAMYLPIFQMASAIG